MTAQLALRLEHPEHSSSLIVRHYADQRVLRADCDWTRVGTEYRSANGWAVRVGALSAENGVGAPRPAGVLGGWGWVAVAPDGAPEWWAHDPVTAMVRAEGGS